MIHKDVFVYAWGLRLNHKVVFPFLCGYMDFEALRVQHVRVRQANASFLQGVPSMFGALPFSALKNIIHAGASHLGLRQCRLEVYGRYQAKQRPYRTLARQSRVLADEKAHFFSFP
jgi:hypothetical protein